MRLSDFLIQLPRKSPVRAQRLVLLIALFCFLDLSVYAAAEGEAPQPRLQWTAEWIAHPTAPLREPAVFHFRKQIDLKQKPSRFIVEVSADNRFILFVNGERIGEGPARGDLAHWRYETFDLAPAMRAGRNVIAATVWNWGIYAPLAQISDRSAFLMQGDTQAEVAANTNASWRVEREAGLTFVRRTAQGLWAYWAADPGESLDARQYDWHWKDGGASAVSHWVAAAAAIRESIYPQTGVPVRLGETPSTAWQLTPDPLPQMQFLPESAGNVVRSSLSSAGRLPDSPVVVPPHSSVEVLLDHGVMMSGYPDVTVSDGRGSRIQLGYTEALYDDHMRRADRNYVGNGRVLGLFDEFVSDGGHNRQFTPLWFRTWRYLELNIHTGDEPLRIEKVSAHFSAFPFVERGQFRSSDAELSKIWEICWRTARLDAHETYMDTPFWEQLQYIEDTRIQVLISYAITGDDRLARQALQAFDDSRVPEGITQSRYPALLPQFIPTFSLLYINMLHDYWMYRDDPGLVRALLPGTRRVLAWFLARQREDGFLEKLPYWLALDDPPGRKNFPVLDSQGRSALVTLYFAGALQDAAELEEALGDPALAGKYRVTAAKARVAVYHECWNIKFGLLADTPDQTSFSEHTNIFAVLTGAVPVQDQAALLRRLPSLRPTGQAGVPEILPATDHYRFYLARAMDKAGLGQQYLGLLGPWRGMLARGLTTTPEYEDPTRSDTHAWSAHPIYDFLTIVAGIHPAAPGFAAVRIVPSPGTLDHFQASMPVADAEITEKYSRDSNGVAFVVNLPAGLPGTLIWNTKEYPLHSGEQVLRLSAAGD